MRDTVKRLLMPSKTDTMDDLAFLCIAGILTAIVFIITWVWRGDDRWLWTAIVVAVGSLVVFLMVAVLYVLKESSEGSADA